MYSHRMLAHDVAECFDDNGQQWRATRAATIRDVEVAIGDNLSDVLDRLAGACDAKPGTTDVHRWTFTDGSVITIAGDGWDFGFPSCFCWSGAGHLDECHEET